MAFNDLPAAAHSFSREALVNTVTASVQKSGTVLFRISGDIHEKMGAPGFCRIMIGSDEHNGRIAVLPRVMKVEGVKALYKQKGGRSPSFTVGSKRIGVSRVERKTTVLPHEISEHGLIIDVRPLMKPVAVSAAA